MPPASFPDEPDRPQIPEPRLPRSFVRKYWPYFIGIIGVALVSWFVFARTPHNCVSDKCRTIAAFPVGTLPDGKRAGSFIVSKSTRNAIVSDGIAGACLLVDQQVFEGPSPGIAQPTACTKHEECANALPDDKFPGWEGVCHLPSKTCWARPGGGAPQSTLCNKAVATQDGQSNRSNAVPFDPATLARVRSDRKNGPAQIRVLSCLNGIKQGAIQPCAGGPGDVLHMWSEPSSIQLAP